jgi:hypothetical protein
MPLRRALPETLAPTVAPAVSGGAPGPRFVPANASLLGWLAPCRLVRCPDESPETLAPAVAPGVLIRAVVPPPVSAASSRILRSSELGKSPIHGWFSCPPWCFSVTALDRDWRDRYLSASLLPNLIHGSNASDWPGKVMSVESPITAARFCRRGSIVNPGGKTAPRRRPHLTRSRRNGSRSAVCFHRVRYAFVSKGDRVEFDQVLPALVCRRCTGRFVGASPGRFTRLLPPSARIIHRSGPRLRAGGL